MGTEGREGLQVTARGHVGDITKEAVFEWGPKECSGFGPALWKKFL